ncbi:centromere-associated protein E isoform X3 [Astyanax mexicanus]|uniref:centromere-associated protein E isoform X3 n=1 Tax=Astyanax mexicanus TaxID=7994 RepID=UPI0020CAC068|nr:centromere-associated protein E isoform X3 [Astyanax mexicanus]
MAANRDTPCRKFQANMFNKSKCQNCFRPRDTHLLTDEDLTQAKPVYGGWLLLAPEGTNFDNPLHRSRKWQRRFFLLYEHGLLRYALDDMASTLPQGTINLNVCVDVLDGETATGQKHSLCISTPEREHYIRAESREVINGWQEALIVFPRTNKQNQKKKRKVEPPTPQVPDVVRTQFSLENTNGYTEPGPAKVAVTSSTSLGYLSEERWTRPPITTSRSVSCLSQHSEDSGSVIGGRKPRVESGYFSLEKTKPEDQQDHQQDQDPPPQHLPLSSSSSSSSSRLRYSTSDSMLFSTAAASGSHHTHPTNTHTHGPAHSERTAAAPDTHGPAHRHAPGSSLSSSQSSLDSVDGGAEGRGSAQVGGAAVMGVGGSTVRTGRGGRSYAALADVPRARRLTHREAFRSERKRQEIRERTRSPGREEVERLFGQQRRRSQVIERFETQQSADGLEHMDTTCSSSELSSSSTKPTNERTGRSERRLPAHKQDLSLDASTARTVPDFSGTTLASYRRAKSLDRRVTESSMTPDLLNFKKGWMTKLYEDGLWKKHWFVLTDQSLRYYRDSIAEEAADLDGEIDLSTCYDVTEYPVQRNYGFQIHSKEGLFTLSAMTSGIRRNWIQAIMKSVRPTITPDVTRSLPDEQAKARASLDLTQTPDVSRTSHSTKVEVQRSCEVISDSAPPTEQRKTRVRDRRREGRSKTFDWAEFRPEKEKEGTSRERTETLDVSSASSPSSLSSSASSPVSSTSSPQTSSSLSAPGPAPSDRRLLRQEEEVEEECTKRGHDCRRYFHPSASLPPSATVAGTTVTDGHCKPPSDAPQDHGTMDVDSAASVGVASVAQTTNHTPDVQVEIEQRWHQVETTPLREEKQVPITSSPAPFSTGERIPPQELAALLDKELGQTQRELVRLQEQNSLLQEQLQDARGREHSAREGYVLQSATSPGQPSSPSSSSISSSSSSVPHQVPWQRLSKLNQELKTELEAQQRKQDLVNQQVTTLRRSYSEAQGLIGHHETEIEALQAKLASAMEEIVASEQAVARMRSELKLEQERYREHEEEWTSNEATLRAQLRDSEERLRDVEASLLEKTQALRLLERQQALQRDQRKEVQRLQERLTEVTGRLIATEEAQALREEREKKEQRSLEEKHERERQGLTRRLAESEEKKREVEEQLQELREQVDALLRGNADRVTGSDVKLEVLRLQQQLNEQTDTMETLQESVRRLQEERDHLMCRCQELVNQIAEADREVGKLQERLKTEETDYYSLESSYERVSEEFAKISRVLREKEEEVRQTKEMYEQLVRQKEQDLNEAFIKMAALGSSLEETELRLQAREDLLKQMGCGEVEPCEAEKELKAKLAVAEDRIAELEQHLDALRLGYADLKMEHGSSQENVLETLEEEMERDASSSNTSSSMTLTRSSSETEVSLAKRQRIRFSNIQCQKYHQSQGVDRFHLDSTSMDITQEISEDLISETSQNLTGDGDINQVFTQDISIVSDSSLQYCSDTEKFMSIIHALETKLKDTEEKLRDITAKIQNQQEPSDNVEPVEARSANTCAEPDLDMPDGKFLSCLERTVQDAQDRSYTHVEYNKALAFVESCRTRVQKILSNHNGDDDSSADAQVHALADIEKDLVSATFHMRQVGGTSIEVPQTSASTESQSQTDETTIQTFSRMLAFEGIVLEKMAIFLEDPKSGLMQSLSEINRDTDNLKKSHQGCLSIVYMDLLVRKLMLESKLVDEVQQHLSQQASTPVQRSVLAQSIVCNVCINAELAYSLQDLKHAYQDKFDELQRDLLKVNETLQQRDTVVREAVGTLNTAGVTQEISNKPSVSTDPFLADVTPLELAPYTELIEMEEARSLAEEIVERHLAGAMEAFETDSTSFLQTGRKSLIEELKTQAKVLHHLSQQVDKTFKEGSGTVHSALAGGIQGLLGNKDSRVLTCSALCMHEALIQAQVAYIACRLRADHQRELLLCQETSRSMATLVQEHAQSVAAIHQRYQSSLEEERLSFSNTVSSLQEENGTLREETALRLQELKDQRERLAQLDEAFRRESEDLKRRHSEELSQVEQERAASEVALTESAAESQRKLDALLQQMEGTELRHEEHVHRLEQEFRGRIQELESTHKEEIQKLHDRYSQTIRTLGEKFEHLEEDVRQPNAEEVQESCPMEEGEGPEQEISRDSMSVLRDRVQELEQQMSSMRDELENKPPEGDVVSLREKYQRDFDSLKETCERGFVAMEETHQKVIEDLHRQHQREINKLLEERERLLEEETNATIAAIEAMKNAHREELEKSQRAQLSGVSADIEQLRMQYEEELQSIHRELEVLSEQYSQKCLENAHLAQALEAERQALQQCQRENQQLHTHNQELNNRLTVEITRMRSCLSGDKAVSPLTQGKDLYELEVLLRIKESEIQYLKQEINSLKDELQSALRDKKYACDKYKDIYTELSIVRAKADCDISKLREKLLAATEALGDRDADGGAVTPGYDIMKSKSNPDFLKKERSAVSRPVRGVRSKVRISLTGSLTCPTDHLPVTESERRIDGSGANEAV